MMLGVEGQDALEFLWFGDCAALVQQGDGPVTIIGDTLDKRAAEAGRAAKAAKEKNKPSTERANFLDSLRASRNRINSGDSWLFSPDVKAASHVSRRLVKTAPGMVLLLATDGFLALASDYGAYDADSLIAAARKKGLAALGQELRAIEAGDAGGAKFPRFKTSDDATALLLQIS